MSSAAVISVSDLVKQYKTVRAVDGISFDVPPGSVTALLGGNGAGKTTTIAMMLGALLPTSGRVQMLGHDMAKDRFRALARMNFSSPYVDLPKKLTVRENLRIYGRLYGVRDLEKRIDALAEELDLGEFIDRGLGKLSAGQQTRASLAKSLVNAPDLLLLDEPTASLDPDTADRIRGYLQDHCKRSGMTILLASHNMKEVERLCDNVLMMKRGKIVDRGTPADLVKRYGRKDMEEVFLDVARGTSALSAPPAHHPDPESPEGEAA
ncbi:MAG: ABC transporter ATP-binding protein [Alphaproteobacteria bacterium]|nr:ABC transporter ATP-binding protein [Alphaproteobacteria bacterium]